jgi:hypothetical protein
LRPHAQGFGIDRTTEMPHVRVIQRIAAGLFEPGFKAPAIADLGVAIAGQGGVGQVGAQRHAVKGVVDQQ